MIGSNDTYISIVTGAIENYSEEDPLSYVVWTLFQVYLFNIAYMCMYII